MSRRVVPWVAAAATAACSSSYAVGGLEPELNLDGDGSIGVAGSPSSSAGGSSIMPTPTEGGGVSIGGSMSTGVGEPTLAPGCTDAGAPATLAGPFVQPSVLWQRLSPLIWGRQVAPPSELPDVASYDWAATLVEQGIAQALALETSLGGADAFVRSYLDLDESADLRGRYGVNLGGTSAVVPVLLATFLENDEGRIDQRQGIFNEPSWLTRYPTISARGEAMLTVLFADPVPSHPSPFEPPAAQPGLSDRATLEQQTAAASCQECHARIDSLGVALGHFDEAGNYRATDDGLEIDTSGSVYLPSGNQLTFDDLQVLTVRLTYDCDTNLGIADAFLSYAVGQQALPETEQRAALIASQNRVRQAFVDGGRTYPALLRAYAQSPAALAL